MTRGDLRDEILVRSGKDTTSAWVTDAILNDWLSQSHRWAANFKKWPFPEGRVSTTWASSTEEWDFAGYQSIVLLLLLEFFEIMLSIFKILISRCWR